MERILLTGASGFIGKELVKALQDKYDIHIIERYVTGRYTLDTAIKHYANLTDYAAIRRIVKTVMPDYCIHLGALSAVAFSYDHYIEVGEVNYLGTVNLAEACYRENPDFKQFLFAGTSEEYGMALKNNAEKLYEDSGLQPNSPYAVAKVASDLYLKYMGMAYDFPYTIIRPFNSYGRIDNDHFFIERTITQMLKGDTVRLGDPNTVRDWLFVSDHVDGYIKALGNKRAIKQEIQLCTGRGYTTKETAELIAKMTGFKGKIIWNSTPPRPLDAKILIGSNISAKKLLGWEPKVTLKKGLEITITRWRTKKND